MFNSITITAKEANEQRLGIGFFAESLLFYGSVNVIADKFLLPELLRLAPPWDIAELIKSGRIKLFLKENYIGVPMYQANGIETYDVQTLSSDSITRDSLLFDGFIETGWSTDDARRATTLVGRYSSPYRYELSYYDEIQNDLRDQDYLKQAICSIIMTQNDGAILNPANVQATYNLVGTYGPFNMHRLQTNINFQNYPNSTPSGIILGIAEARGDIHIASHFNSEIASRKLTSKLIQNRFNSLVTKFENNQAAISQFQNVILSECKCIGEAVKSGEISFKQFLKILNRADKFRHWLGGLDKNNDILSEYYKAVFKRTIADKLPTKVLRFAIFNGAGFIVDKGIPVAGSALATALSASDTFLVDKILHGWKPNQFIEEVRNQLPLR